MFESLLQPEALQSYSFFASVTIIPFYVMIKRAGFNPLWSLMLFIPYSGLFLVLGFLAFRRWPAEPAKPKKKGA